MHALSRNSDSKGPSAEAEQLNHIPYTRSRSHEGGSGLEPCFCSSYPRSVTFHHGRPGQWAEFRRAYRSFPRPLNSNIDVQSSYSCELPYLYPDVPPTRCSHHCARWAAYVSVTARGRISSRAASHSRRRLRTDVGITSSSAPRSHRVCARLFPASPFVRTGFSPFTTGPSL